MIISSADTLTRRVHDSSVALAFHAPVATIHSKDYIAMGSQISFICPPLPPLYISLVILQDTKQTGGA